MTVLALDGIARRFGDVEVLRGVTLSVAAGEVHALLGENGAGKSTLVKTLLGVHVPDAGTMLLDGAPYQPRSPKDARRRGVVLVPQERTLCPDLSVVENVVLGIEPGRFGILDGRKARATAAHALGLVGGERIALDARARTLGVADQQLVEIARALASAEASGARVLVLDEPTSSLGHDDAERLFERIAALAEAGLAVVLVTHFLGDVRAHAHRYTVLRDGVVQGSGDARTTEPGRIVAEMLGRELAAVAGAVNDASSSEAVALTATDLGGRVRPQRASFTLRRGEILGIAGLVGSGRTELLRILAGLDRPAHGSFALAAKGIGLLSEDRAGEGLMLGRSIAENVSLSPRGPFLVGDAQEEAEGQRWIGELSIKARDATQPAGELSGGNQQKVQLARLLREDHEVLLVDEPTLGIDVASKAQVLALLRELARRGKAIMLVSSQLDELVTTCDRIAILRRGVLEAPVAAGTFTEDRLLLAVSA